MSDSFGFPSGIKCPVTDSTCQRKCQFVHECAGKVVMVDKLLPPAAPEPLIPMRQMFIDPTKYFCVYFPDTPEHRALALKMSEQKPGAMLPLTLDEIALLSEFFVWPPRSA